MLAVLVPDITNPHHFGLIRGAEERARSADRTLVLGDTHGDPALEADHLDRLGSVVDGIRQIVAHLSTLGHRRIAYLAGPRRSWSDGRRWAALTVEAAEAGATVARLGPFAPALDGGPAAADAGLASGATALVAYNDLLAIGVLRRLEERGVPVPEAVSVTGFDDVFGADFCHPPLTTVGAPTEEAGRALVGVLLDDETADPQRTVLPVRLVVRASTGPAR